MLCIALAAIAGGIYVGGWITSGRALYQARTRYDGAPSATSVVMGVVMGALWPATIVVVGALVTMTGDAGIFDKSQHSN